MFGGQGMVHSLGGGGGGEFEDCHMIWKGPEPGLQVCVQ